MFSFRVPTSNKKLLCNKGHRYERSDRTLRNGRYERGAPGLTTSNKKLLSPVQRSPWRGTTCDNFLILRRAKLL